MILASDNPASNRNGPTITAELVAEIKRLARENPWMSLLDIADAVRWPHHCSLRRIRQWVESEIQTAR